MDTVLNETEDNFALPRIPDLERRDRTGGGDALVQTFYEGPEKCKCCKNWVEREPKEVPDIVKQRYDRAAIQVFKCKDHRSPSGMLGGLAPMHTAYIEIQSQIICDAIRPILTDIGMLIAKSEPIKVKAPFRELYHAYSRIIEIQQQQMQGTVQREHLDVFLEVLKELLSDMSQEIADLQAKKAITYKYLWTIYPKGIIAHSQYKGKDRLYQVVDGYSLDYSMSVECRYIAFDGSKWGWCTTEIRISHFDDERLISKLPLQPIGYHDGPDLEQRMVERGKIALEYQHIRHMEYTGIVLSAEGFDQDEATRFEKPCHVSFCPSE